MTSDAVSGGGGGFTTLLQWVGAAPPLNASFPPAVMLATGVVCASGVNASIEKLNVFTNEKFVLDFVASRTAAVPASPVGRHGALTLAPATGSAATRRSSSLMRPARSGGDGCG